ncbi:hypothetical protein, partial [uncultured Lutibacter sp.]|uniref:hypothetical protein n=1 Tax=uncultured Lutibacter sp. TaxID=437739 RepID=UPI0026360F76
MVKKLLNPKIYVFLFSLFIGANTSLYANSSVPDNYVELIPAVEQELDNPLLNLDDYFLKIIEPNLIYNFNNLDFLDKSSLAPIVICRNITVQLDATGNVTIAENEVNNGSTGNGTLSFDTNITNFTCSDVGTPVNVILTVTDDDGSGTCVATVTVEDVTAPNVITQNITVQLDTTGIVT